MPKGRSYSASTNRSGTKRRRVISTADSTASTDSTADGPADCQAGSDQGERLLGGQQVGGNVQLSSDRGKVMATDVVGVPEESGSQAKPNSFQPIKHAEDCVHFSFYQCINRGTDPKGPDQQGFKKQ